MPHIKVAIVGKPNVGKSTLFNRLIGKRIAVVSNIAGTTRDRNQHIFTIDRTKIELVDTGGLFGGSKKTGIEENVEKQAKIGIEKADLIIFLLDASTQTTPDDAMVADLLRRSQKPIILVANKCDNQDSETNIFGLYELGFGEPIEISAIHDTGIDILKETLKSKIKKLKLKAKEKVEETDLSIAIIGRPNVGKSSLLNSFLNEERVIVSEISGTTRDSTDTQITYNDKKITLTDTAGIKRRGRIERGIEKFSFIRCKESIEKSDVAIVLIDGIESVTTQDLHVIQLVLEEKRGLVIGVNKMDAVEPDEKDSMERRISYKCDFIPWAPLVYISAKNKKNIYKLLDLAIQIKETRQKKIPTKALNNFLKKITLKNLPAAGKNVSKFFYANQIGDNPPKFIIFFRNASKLHFSYRRYIENEIRKEFGFDGTPISITFRDSTSSSPRR